MDAELVGRTSELEKREELGAQTLIWGATLPCAPSTTSPPPPSGTGHTTPELCSRDSATRQFWSHAEGPELMG